MISSITFFGTQCEFANSVRDRLMANGYRIAAQVIPGNPDEAMPVQRLDTATRPTGGRRLPMSPGPNAPAKAPRVLQVNDHEAEETVRTLGRLDSDLAVVCCYPRRLPMPLIATSKHGGLNVHPSLLPRYRGPDPLFWLYRNGETEAGVTIHRVDRRLDTGAIVRQQRFQIPVGAPGDKIWSQLSSTAAELLVEAIEARSGGDDSETPQSSAGASYFSWPTATDMLIEPGEWDAWRVYHFCRGVIPLGHMPRLVSRKTVRRVIDVTGYADVAGSRGVRSPGAETIECRSGEVYLALGPAIF